jgi:GT2 family glycosyltransferase
MLHRTVYQELGGWDRGFFLDHEDVDLFLRAWQAGWKCVTVPGSKVYHAVNVSNVKTIGGGRQRVGRRRYISGRSSLMILGVKYFSPMYAAMLVCLWAATTTRHALTLNLNRLWWSLLAGKEFLVRLPAALQHRFQGPPMGRNRGERLFKASEFQVVE